MDGSLLTPVDANGCQIQAEVAVPSCFDSIQAAMNEGVNLDMPASGAPSNNGMVLSGQ